MKKGWQHNGVLQNLWKRLEQEMHERTLWKARQDVGIGRSGLQQRLAGKQTAHPRKTPQFTTGAGDGIASIGTD
jgi:hypothetical protein